MLNSVKKQWELGVMPRWLAAILASRRVFHFTLISALWILSSALVNPAGEFPLNDDWAYAYPVYSLSELGTLRIPGHVTPNLIGQVLWATPLAKTFGFSFLLLRLSTLWLGLIALLFLYEIFLELKASSEIAVIGVAVLAANPLFFALSHTFMTDVPFCAFGLAATWFWLRGMNRSSLWHQGAAVLFAALAILTRQVGIALFIGFALSYWAKHSLRPRAALIALPLGLLGWCFQKGYELWLSINHLTPVAYGLQYREWMVTLQQGFGKILGVIISNLSSVFIYLGLFVFPFLLLFSGEWFRSISAGRRKLRVTFFLIVFVATMAFLIQKDIRIPFMANILTPYGVGPLTLRDTYFLEADRFFSLPSSFWWIVTALGAWGAWLLVTCLGRVLYLLFSSATVPSLSSNWVMVFVLGTSAAFLFPLLLIKSFDRYFIFIVPFFQMAVLLTLRPPTGMRARYAIASSVIFVILFQGFSVAATHDYFAWNRARWNAIAVLDARGISANRVDGGYEYNGSRLYNPAYRYTAKKSWWWVDDDEYLLTFTKVAGYEEVGGIPFTTWLPVGMERIRILKRTN